MVVEGGFGLEISLAIAVDVSRQEGSNTFNFLGCSGVDVAGDTLDLIEVVFLSFHLLLDRFPQVSVVSFSVMLSSLKDVVKLVDQR